MFEIHSLSRIKEKLISKEKSQENHEVIFHLNKKILLIQEELSEMNSGDYGIASRENLIEKLSEINIDYSVLLSFSQLTDEYGNIIVYDDNLSPQSIKKIFKNLPIPELRLLLSRLKLTITQEKKVIQRELDFFQKESKTLSQQEKDNIEELSANRNQSEKYTTAINQIANAKELETSPEALTQDIARSIIHLGEILDTESPNLNDQEKTGILWAIKTINKKIKKLFWQSKTPVSLREISGVQNYDTYFARLSKPATSKKHTSESFTKAKNDFKNTIFSSRVTTALGCFSLVENGNLAQDDSLRTLDQKSFSEVFNVAFFDDLDNFSHITNTVKLIRSSDDFTNENHQNAAIAHFIKTEVAKGNLDYVMAQNYFESLKSGNINKLLTQYMSSFFGSFGEYSYKSSNKLIPELLSEKGKLKIRLSLMTVIMLLTLTFSKPDKSIKDKNNDFSIDIANFTNNGLSGAGDLSKNFIKKIEQGLGIDILNEEDFNFFGENNDSTASNSNESSDNQITPEEKTIAFTEASQRAISVIDYTPLTTDKLTNPQQESIRNGFEPTRVSPEAYLDMAKIVDWEMSNWETSPGELTVATYTSVDPTTGKYYRETPNQELSGATIPLIADLNSGENILYGERNTLSTDWADALIAPEHYLSAASITYEADSSEIITLPVEIVVNNDTGNTFTKLVLTQEQENDLGSAKNIKVYYQYTMGENTLSNEFYFGTNPEIESFVPYEVLSLDAQNTIESINDNNNLSDIDSMRQMQRWFHGFGYYSFNPLDDQHSAINKQIAEGVINPEDASIAYYDYFYNGITGQEFPRPGAGECNRRNTAALPAFLALDLNDDWDFRLVSGFSLGESRYDTNQTNKIRSSQRHMYVQGLNKATGEIINLDVTGAPETDESTQKVLATNQEVSDHIYNGPENDEAWRYEPSPEVLKHPSIFPSVEFSADDFEPIIRDDPGYFTADETYYANALEKDDFLNTTDMLLSASVIFPWKIINYSMSETDNPHIMSNPDWESTSLITSEEPFTSMHIYRSMIPLEINNGVISYPTNLTQDVGDMVGSFESLLFAKGINRDTSKHYQLSIELNDGNVIPILLENEKILDMDSISITDEYGYPVPYRIERFEGYNALAFVIDLPPEILKNTILKLDYKSIDKYASSPYSYPDLETSFNSLIKSGFSKNEAIFMIIYNNKNDYDKIKSFLEKQNLPEEYNTFILEHYSSGNYSTRRVIELFPNLMKELHEAGNLRQFFTESIFYLNDDPNELLAQGGVAHQFLPDILLMEKLIEQGEDIADHYHDFSILFSSSTDSRYDDPRINYIVINHINSKYLPSENYGSSSTLETSAAQFCIDLYDNPAGCFIKSPHKNPLMLSYLSDEIYRAIYPDTRSNKSFSLEPYGDSYILYGKSYLGLRFFVDENSIKDQYPLYTSDNTSEKPLTLDDEIEATEEWANQMIKESLLSLNPYTTIPFAILYLISLALFYAGAQQLAKKTRWAKTKSITDLIKNLVKNQNIISTKDGDITPNQLDQAWHGHLSPSDKRHAQHIVRNQLDRSKRMVPFPLGTKKIEKKVTVVNLWESREVPPTYFHHTNLFQLTTPLIALAEEITTSDATENDLVNIAFVINNLLDHGIASLESTKISEFRKNVSVLTDKEKWIIEAKKTFLTLLKEDDKADPQIVDINNIDNMLHQLTIPWTLIMKDWQMMMGKTN